MSHDIKCNTQSKIISDFQELILDAGKLDLGYHFGQQVLSINQNGPEETFAKAYVEKARDFLAKVIHYREAQVTEDKEVVTSYYQA